jgi:hypothetical protein
MYVVLLLHIIAKLPDLENLNQMTFMVYPVNFCTTRFIYLKAMRFWQRLIFISFSNNMVGLKFKIKLFLTDLYLT